MFYLCLEKYVFQTSQCSYTYDQMEISVFARPADVIYTFSQD